MKAKIFTGLFIILLLTFSSNAEYNSEKAKKIKLFEYYSQSLYSCIADNDLDFNIFKIALKGYYTLKVEGKLNNFDFLTIIDYCRSANVPRFFVIDLSKKQLLFKKLVAHGKNSGEEYASIFSNKSGSAKSSLGFYLTGETYFGDNGFSLRLDGLEESFNDKARERTIVIHPADYVCDSFICTNGRLGRSRGCPSLPLDDDYSNIIDIIKDKSCLFAYYPDTEYLQASRYLKTSKYLEVFSSNLLSELQK